jgi:type IV pilus assembly protein PilX
MINQHLVKAKHQSGVVLVISLIMLLALTLIGVTSSSVTGLETKMAANTKDVNLAFQAAEATLRDVETNVLKTKPDFKYTVVDANQGTNGIYTTLTKCEDPSSANMRTATSTPPYDTTRQPFYTKVDWYGTKVVNYTNISGSTTKLVGLSRPPAYIIEEIGCSPAVSGGTTSGSLGAGGTITPTSGETIIMRITAHGWGSNANSVATIQSVVKVTY